MADKPPPLSFEALQALTEIEVYAESVVITCIGIGGVDSTRAIRTLRTCADGMFAVMANYYARFGLLPPNTLEHIQNEVAESIGTIFKVVIPKDKAEQEAREVMSQLIQAALSASPAQPQSISPLMESSQRKKGQFTIADIDQPVQPIGQKRKAKQIPEPNPQLLENNETLNRLQAAKALGVHTRTLDRWIKGGKLTPIGASGRKRIKTKELRKFLDQKPQDN
jgi:hypothetical protein